ncbi:MAG: PLP-dependent cysteine synthase family protein [Terriglobales bacterium]
MSTEQNIGERGMLRPRLGTTLVERIGNTPLLRLDRASKETGALILAKAEWMNPGGSVKDLAAAYIVRDAMQNGSLRRGVRLLDATSGNTGIAYAMLGAAMGFGVTLCMPENVSPERKRMLQAYGAEVIYTDPLQGSDGAIRKAREIIAAEPERYFYADQYSNPANWRAHYETTALEICRATDDRLTHFVAMLGTSGTFVGTARRLKELNANVRCVSLQPDSPFHGIEGAKHMASAIVPEIYDPEVADEDRAVSTEAAHAMVKWLAREEGLLVGVSAGAALAGAIQVAREAGRKAVVVTIFPDGADKYLSERFWEES